MILWLCLFCLPLFAQDTWYNETLYGDWQQRLRIDRMIYEEQTEQQHLVIFENPTFGRVLALDGVIQTTDAFEYVYHEMMVHVPLLTHENPKNVLIIGGGDGGILREVMRHKSVERVTMVEIDPKVISMCKEYFPGHSNGAFEDPRAKIVIADGCDFVKNTEEKFDVIIVDSTDPIGPGEVLFTSEFYGHCQKALAPAGILVNQNGVPTMQPSELLLTLKNRAPHFKHIGFFFAPVPHYVGGLMALGWATNDDRYTTCNSEGIQKKYTTLQGQLKYYTPQIHQAAFATPQFIKNILN